MTRFFLSACFCFALIGCGKSDKDKLIDELGPVIDEIGWDKKEEAKYRIITYERAKIDGNLKAKDFAQLAAVHAIAMRFYQYTDEFKNEYEYKNEFPEVELILRFKQAFDSIAMMLPEEVISAFDYTKSEHRSHLLLTIIRMNHDIANHEVTIMEALADRY